MSNKHFVTQAADIAINTSGDNEIIPARENKRIYVWKLYAVSEGAVNVKFSHGSSYFNSRAHHLTADGSSITFAFDGEPYFKGDAGENFGINLSGAVYLSGQAYYTYED